MTGLLIMVMRMKSNINCIREKLASRRPRDLVSLKTVWSDCNTRYLVIKVNKKMESIDLLPLEGYYERGSEQEVPVLSVPFDMITELEAKDKGDLLFLANQTNPHIIKALESM